MRAVHESAYKPKLTAALTKETKFIVNVRPVNQNAAAQSIANNEQRNSSSNPVDVVNHAANAGQCSGRVGVVAVEGGGRVAAGRFAGSGEATTTHRGGHLHNSRSEVNWQRIFTVSSLIVSLLLISGSIYLHLRQKHHFGRLNMEQHSAPQAQAAGVAAAALVAPTLNEQIEEKNIYNINSKPTLSALPFSSALEAQQQQQQEQLSPTSPPSLSSSASSPSSAASSSASSPSSSLSAIQTLIHSDFKKALVENAAVAIQTLRAILHGNHHNNNNNNYFNNKHDKNNYEYKNNENANTKDNDGHVIAAFAKASTPDSDDMHKSIASMTAASKESTRAESKDRAAWTEDATAIAPAIEDENIITISSTATTANSIASIDFKQSWMATNSRTAASAAAAAAAATPHITEACMQCICETTTKCRPATCGGNNNVDCGIFRISHPYWLDAGKPALEATDENITSNNTNSNNNHSNYNSNTKSNATTTYDRCVNNIYCATRTVAAYINRYARDCNRDGAIECRDHIALHLLGPRGCIQSNGQLQPIYEKHMKDCLARYT